MVDVILPVLNEVEALPWVLSRFPAGYRPLVIDNGSDDGSAGVAARLGATVIQAPERGFGAACWRGLVSATSDIVAFMDCDGSLDPRQLPVVVEPIRQGHADLMLGRRRALPGAWPAHARVANRALALELRRRSGTRLHDIGPLRAAHRRSLLDLGLADRRFGWPLEMVVKAAQADWRIAEVAVDYRPRVGGRSKVSGSLRGSLRAARDMAAVLR
jgi:glycosyltransferase involved in cell wall biosynthesis